MKKINKKFFSRVKEYPYIFLLLLSGFCVYISVGFAELHGEENVDRGSQTVDGDIEDTEGRGPEETQESAQKENAQEDTGTEAGGNAQESTEGNPREDEGKYAQESAEGHGQDNEPVDPQGSTTGQEQGGAAVDSSEKPVGITEFVYYEPTPVDSPYYSDPGKIALTTEYPYETVEDDYFADAAFIGDSRMLGLFDYSGLETTDFYCDNGFCTYLWKKGKGVTYQNENRKVILEDVMDEKSYRKIYLMLGLNDCGYGNVEDFKGRYGELLDMLHTKQPDAVIYLLAALHLSKEKSDSDDVYNNVDINAHNVAIAELADGETFFYVDVNSLFTDEERYLKPELTFDGTHLYADGYMEWMEYLKQYAVVR